MYLNGEEESALKGRLYAEFRDVELERLRKDEPGRYQIIIKNAQEYEHERWVYVGNRFTEIKYNLKKQNEKK